MNQGAGGGSGTGSGPGSGADVGTPGGNVGVVMRSSRRHHHHHHRRRRSKWRRLIRTTLKWAAIVLTGASIAFIIGASTGVLYYHLGDPFNDRVFDASVWRDYREDAIADNPRGNMAEDLKRRLMSQRPTYDEVVKMLGEPDYMTEAERMRDDLLRYNLGMWTGLRTDNDSLDIYFDEQRRVREVRIAQH